MKQTILHTTWCAVLALTLSACQQQATIPETFTETTEAIEIYPDYTDITIPPNIAPLNFMVKQDAQGYIAQIGCGDQQLIASAQTDGKVQFDETAWKSLLQNHRGDSLTLTIYTKNENGWLRHLPYKLFIAQEDIDPYLSYRLIEPGYEAYRQVGLYQRNLTNFEVHTIYENNRSFDNEHNHCINCHNYQNYSTKQMLFHVRAMHGGTVIARNGEIHKMNLTADSILSSSVYPSWHPTQNWIVFSSNKTGQTFHIQHSEKIEVVDTESDLVFYDADKRTIQNILRTDHTLENFPCWHPDGKKLYYCAAYLPQLAGKSNAERSQYIVAHYDSIHYNIMSLTFDPQTCRFGTPVMEVNCDSIGKSASVPRISPDGRYLLFTLGDYGQFHIWHKSADLYLKDLHTGVIRRLDHASGKDADSYHTWSSNGRWMVFSSRRDDGSYTRPYIAYLDAQGHDRKAFILPQEDPEQNLLLLKSYNVPELTKDAVPYHTDDFKKVIYESEGEKVQYINPDK